MKHRTGLQPRKRAAGRAALLVMDLISDFEFPDGPRVRRVLAARAPAIRRLLERARKNRIPVIYLNDNIGAWRSDSAALIARCTQTWRAGGEVFGTAAGCAAGARVLGAHARARRVRAFRRIQNSLTRGPTTNRQVHS